MTELEAAIAAMQEVDAQNKRLEAIRVDLNSARERVNALQARRDAVLSELDKAKDVAKAALKAAFGSL